MSRGPGGWRFLPRKIASGSLIRRTDPGLNSHREFTWCAMKCLGAFVHSTGARVLGSRQTSCKGPQPTRSRRQLTEGNRHPSKWRTSPAENLKFGACSPYSPCQGAVQDRGPISACG
eukprot:8567776-Pyramimonas_sp.AAC.1